MPCAIIAVGHAALGGKIGPRGKSMPMSQEARIKMLEKQERDLMDLNSRYMDDKKNLRETTESQARLIQELRAENEELEAKLADFEARVVDNMAAVDEGAGSAALVPAVTGTLVGG